MQCLGKAHRRSVRKKQLCNKLYTATHIKHAATYIHHTTAHIHHAALHRNTLQHNASVARACRLWCCNTRTTHCNIHTSHRDTPRHTASVARACRLWCCNTHTAHCNTHTTHCNTPQHTVSVARVCRMGCYSTTANPATYTYHTATQQQHTATHIHHTTTHSATLPQSPSPADWVAALASSPGSSSLWSLSSRCATRPLTRKKKVLKSQHFSQ